MKILEEYKKANKADYDGEEPIGYHWVREAALIQALEYALSFEDRIPGCFDDEIEDILKKGIEWDTL